MKSLHDTNYITINSVVESCPLRHRNLNLFILYSFILEYFVWVLDNILSIIEVLGLCDKCIVCVTCVSADSIYEVKCTLKKLN